MSRKHTMLVVLIAGAIASVVQSFHYPPNCTETHSDLTYLVQYKPFMFCGSVTNIAPESEERFFVDRSKIEQSCLIGCINRTRHALAIAIFNCRYELDMLFQPYNDELEFAECHKDTEFILRGSTLLGWVEFTLRPNISCLRNKARASCGQIFDYSRQYARDLTVYDDLEVGVKPLDLNRRIWTPNAKNGGDSIDPWAVAGHGVSMLVLRTISVHLLK